MRRRRRTVGTGPGIGRRRRPSVHMLRRWPGSRDAGRPAIPVLLWSRLRLRLRPMRWLCPRLWLRPRLRRIALTVLLMPPPGLRARYGHEIAPPHVEMDGWRRLPGAQPAAMVVVVEPAVVGLIVNARVRVVIVVVGAGRIAAERRRSIGRRHAAGQKRRHAYRQTYRQGARQPPALASSAHPHSSRCIAALSTAPPIARCARSTRPAHGRPRPSRP